MGCASLIVSTPHLGPSASTVRRSCRFYPRNRSLSVVPICASSNSDVVLTADQLEKDASVTGGAYDFKGATTALTYEPLSSSKKVTLVRHGLSSWNQDSRIQGSSNLSLLTDTGVSQAEKCQKALSNIRFDQCFASPISRAKVQTLLSEGPLSLLKEVHGPNALVCTSWARGLDIQTVDLI